MSQHGRGGVAYPYSACASLALAAADATSLGRLPPLTVTYQSDITLIGDRGGRTPKATGGIPMNARNDNTAPKGLRGWWLSPPRPGMQRLIVPYEYRHLRLFGVGRIAGGSVAAAAGVVCLSYGVYEWAAFFLVLGALNLAGGCWYLTITCPASARS
jgi:hypothetical protein